MPFMDSLCTLAVPVRERRSHYGQRKQKRFIWSFPYSSKCLHLLPNLRDKYQKRCLSKNLRTQVSSVPLLLYDDSPILAFCRYLLVHLYIYTFLYFYSSIHGESPWSILTCTVVYLPWTIIVASWYCWLWCCVAAFGQFSIVTEAFIFISDILLHFIESYLPSVSPNLLMKFISMSLLYFYYYFGLVSILRTLILNY